MAYHFMADNSISQNCSPSVLFSLNSRTNLLTSARKCTSLKIFLIRSFGPYDKTSRTNCGSLTPSNVTKLWRGLFHKNGFCLFVKSFTNQFGMISCFHFNAVQNLWNFFFTSFLRMSLYSSIFSSNNLRPCFARFISFLYSLSWKLCTTCFKKNFVFGISKLQKLWKNNIIFQFFKRITHSWKHLYIFPKFVTSKLSPSLFRSF